MSEKTYLITVERPTEGLLLRVSFGAPSSNGPKVRDAADQLAELAANGELAGGGKVFVNGPASMPVAFAIAHEVGHIFSEVWVYDPKEDHYVLSISHSETPIGVEWDGGPR